MRLEMVSRSRMNVNSSSPRAVGGTISRTTYRSRIVGRSAARAFTDES